MKWVWGMKEGENKNEFEVAWIINGDAIYGSPDILLLKILALCLLVFHVYVHKFKVILSHLCEGYSEIMTQFYPAIRILRTVKDWYVEFIWFKIKPCGLK